METTRKRKWLGTVKGRMIVILLLSSIAPLALLGAISYSSFLSFLENTLTAGIQENVEKEMANIDDVVKNLNFASQQIALDAMLAKSIHRSLATSDVLEKQDLLKDVLDRLSLINYSSPYAGILTVLDEQERVIVQTYPVEDQLDLNQYPELFEANGVHYSAPHVSVNKYGQPSDGPVISLHRKVVDFELNTSFFLYFESNFNTVEQLLGGKQYGEPVVHLLLDAADRIVYSEDGNKFPLGDPFARIDKKTDNIRFVAESGQGWKLAVVLRGVAFRAEMDAWLWKFLSIGLLCVMLSLALAYVAWRSIYRPLQVLRKEIEWMGDSRIVRQRRHLRLSEFDDLLLRFYRMRNRVFVLLEDIESRERAKRRIEVDKLRFQINPHFIHNTLNTIQVIAKINKQPEIVRLVTHFTRILHYNLGKEGVFVRVKDEIANLKDYISLQQIRYNHNFQVAFEIDAAYEDALMPRFLLQPIVENTLYHAFKSDEGVITVRLQEEANDEMSITVSDNGEGMSEERLGALMAEQPEEGSKTGMGIGLQFVHRLIRAYYGEAYGLRVDSEPGVGTDIVIRIPTLPPEGEQRHDPDASR